VSSASGSATIACGRLQNTYDNGCLDSRFAQSSLVTTPNARTGRTRRVTAVLSRRCGVTRPSPRVLNVFLIPSDQWGHIAPVAAAGVTLPWKGELAQHGAGRPFRLSPGGYRSAGRPGAR
jgi:hypothetical protein